MAFLRRGNVKVPHKTSAHIVVHRFDGCPVRLRLAQIQCWEEYQHKPNSKVTVMYWDIASSTAVTESFDEIDKAVNGTRWNNV